MQNISAQNIVRSYLYMFLLILIAGLLGSVLSNTFHWGLAGTGAFLIIAGIINLISYYFSDTLIIKLSHAKALTRETAPEYYSLVESLVKRAGIPIPKLYYINTDAINAFATGRSPDHAAVVATRGLLEKLTPEEIKGVLAHELSHIKNFDTRLMAVVSILAGLISIFAEIIWRSQARSSGRNDSGLGAFGAFLALFAPITAFLIQLAVSRKRELVADASGATLSGGGASLASALEKISRDMLPMPQVSRATAHLYITNPFKDSGILDKLFSTHPPLDERIKILRNNKV